MTFVKACAMVRGKQNQSPLTTMTTFSDPTDPKCLLGFRDKLVDRLNKYRQNMGLTYFDRYTVVFKETTKYFKVLSIQWKGNEEGTGNLVAFINKRTGEIFKPASWVAPAKHARGNIMSEQNGMEAITDEGNVIYLR